MSDNKFYTQREERANYITHAIGFVMSLVASYFLLRKGLTSNNTHATIGYGLFSIGMLTCMIASTMYHYESKSKRKSLLRHFDHASIYLLIAASYSPFTLILLWEQAMWGVLILSLIWLIAIIGIIISFRPLKRNNHIKTASYVMMGLVVFIAFKPLIQSAQQHDCMNVIYWLITGGVFYIIGAVIYATAKREFIHALFHIFVLLGLLSHIISAYLITI